MASRGRPSATASPLVLRLFGPGFPWHPWAFGSQPLPWMPPSIPATDLLYLLRYDRSWSLVPMLSDGEVVLRVEGDKRRWVGAAVKDFCGGRSALGGSAGISLDFFVFLMVYCLWRMSVSRDLCSSQPNQRFPVWSW